MSTATIIALSTGIAGVIAAVTSLIAVILHRNNTAAHNAPIQKGDPTS
jgi:hypothetical protein